MGEPNCELIFRYCFCVTKFFRTRGTPKIKQKTFKLCPEISLSVFTQTLNRASLPKSIYAGAFITARVHP
jgi:hypothetical protein